MVTRALKVMTPPERFTVPLQEGLDLSKLTTSGSVLHINEDYDECFENYNCTEDTKFTDFIGDPVFNFEEFATKLTNLDETGLVKKKIIENGGGVLLPDECTVSIAYSGYFEGENDPFDVQTFNKPLIFDMKDNGLLPGLQLAVRSMLVGEVSVFLLSYKVMYGQLGIPPRIKPKSDCIFYIKLIKCVVIPEEEKLDFREPNMFERVHAEVKSLFASGVILFKSKNYSAAMQLFRKGINMLCQCRLADANEEKQQEKTLIKLYMNLAICYNNMKLPLKACTACNELRRLNALWNNSKALFQNAKALRMIGQFQEAKQKITRAIKLTPNSEELKIELELIEQSHINCNQAKLFAERNKDVLAAVNDKFKEEVDNLIRNFKQNVNLYKFTLPSDLRASEVDYVKEACIRENLFFNKIQNYYALDKVNENLE